MTLQMHYQEKFDQGVEYGLERGVQQGIARGVQQSNEKSARRMLEDGELSLDKIAKYSGLTLEQVLELKKELQPV